MPKLDYLAALKAGKSPEEIKAFIDAQGAAGKTIEVLNLPAAPAPQPKKPGFLDKAGSISGKFLGGLAGFTGIDKAGESLGRLGLQTSKQMGRVTGTDATKTFNVPKFSGKQLAGDVATLAGTGLNLAAPGAGRLGRTVAASAGAAGLLGTGQGLVKDKSVSDSVREGATKAALAAIITGGVGLVGKGVGALTKKAPGAIYKTSTRVPNQTDANILLEKGITGSREQLAAKAAKAMGKSEAAIQGSSRLDDAINYGDVLSDPNVQRIGNQAKIVGKGRAFDKVINEVLPQGKVSVPDLRAQVDDLAEQASKTSDPKALQAFHDAFKLLKDIDGRPAATRGGALAVRRAIDANTPNSAFADTATAIEAKTKNAIADALRGTVAKGAPDIAEQLKTEQALTGLQSTLEAFQRAKASPAPYSAGNVLQRTILTPSLGTRMAKGGYETGKALTKAQESIITRAIKRALRIGGTSALGNF